MSTFRAQYSSGTCSACRGPITAGEEIIRNLDSEYMHADCPETELDALAGKTPCPSCWLVGPCDCD